MQLNKSQQLAVDHDKGPMLVLAGPGSGKTAVITERIRRLVECHGVPPEKILVITFSRAAAIEMKQRFGRLTADRYNSVSFGTFHAVFFKVIKSAYHYDNSSIITEEERFRVIRDATRKYNIAAMGDRELTRKLSAAISTIKAENADPLTTGLKLCSPEEFRLIYEEYERYLHSEERLDFDDMMLMCLHLFEEREDVLEFWQERYEYILIDEFQDINELQYRLVGKLAAPQNNVFAVGDDDQSIYGFRGARPEIMFWFERDYADCRRVLLDVNYRSRAEILDASVSLVSHNTERFNKRILAARGNGGEIRYLSFANLEEENEFLLNYIQKARSEGRDAGEIAILYRMNHQARTLYRILSANNVPCRLHEQMPCVFDHWIAEDFISYMKLARGDCSRGEFLRIMNRPARYVTRQSVCEAVSERESVSLEKVITANSDRGYVVTALLVLHRQTELMKTLDPLASVKYIRYAIGYDGYLQEYAKSKHIPAEELSDIVNELEESTRGLNSLDEWMEMMEKVRSQQKEDSDSEHNPEKERNAVELMTFHCSKGLEFDTVFIIDALEGMTPQQRAQSPEELEEERRAFYVAMTRAKNELYVLSSENRLGRTLPVSRFVREAFGDNAGDHGDGPFVFTHQGDGPFCIN